MIAVQDGDTPLLRAVKSRNLEIVKALLDKKASVSATDKVRYACPRSLTDSVTG